MGVRSAITGALTLRGFLAVLTTGLKSFVSDFNLDMLERLLDLAEQHRVLDDLVGLLGEGVERVEDCRLVRSLPGLRPAEVAVAAVGVEVEVGQRLTAQPALVERPAELERVAEPPPRPSTERMVSSSSPGPFCRDTRSSSRRRSSERSPKA